MPPITDPRTRFESSIGRSDGCWYWNGTMHANGYGMFSMKVAGQWKKFWAHRLSYEFFVRPLEPGETIDHLCMNKRCVKPQHLDACSTGENSRRSPRTLQGANARKTHCPHGHPYSGENLFYDEGKRRCRQCVNAKNRAARRRRAAKREAERQRNE